MSISEKSQHQKVALNLPRYQYELLQSRLYHGQMTRILYRFVSSLNWKISHEGKAELNAWIEGESSLTLPKEEEPTYDNESFEGPSST